MISNYGILIDDMQYFVLEVSLVLVQKRSFGCEKEKKKKIEIDDIKLDYVPFYKINMVIWISLQ